MTHLDYLEDMQRLEATARVQSVSTTDDRTDVILDRTIFYPQGGGQPFDRGAMVNRDARFAVEEVRFADGIVHHFGRFENGSFAEGDDVHLSVDPQRRALHSRVHSAGHIVDMAVLALGLGWKPGKGYHFPDGPYVEYSGAAAASSMDREQLKADLEREANRFVRENRATTILFVSKEEMARHCHFVPDELPAGKPQRVVLYGDFGIPCGGTHVARLGDVGAMTIRKLKFSGDTVRVSYGVA